VLLGVRSLIIPRPEESAFSSRPSTALGFVSGESLSQALAGFSARQMRRPFRRKRPAMRSAIIGAFFAENPQKRSEFVLASSR